MKSVKKQVIADGQDLPDVPLISTAKGGGRPGEKINLGFDDPFVTDCHLLAATALRRKYVREANTHRNMLQRRTSYGAIINPAFKDFRCFLKHVGPMPAKGATLDRINNLDPEYGPGKVRWADRRTQNNNKADTIIIYDANTGHTFTASRLAKIQGVQVSTIRKRLKRGWTDQEVIVGKRNERPHRVQAFVGRVRHQSTTPTSAKTFQFARDAEIFQQQRETENCEPFLASLDELNKDLPFGTSPITRSQYMRKLAAYWFTTLRYHVFFDRLLPEQQALVAEVDPKFANASNGGSSI